jgi:capsular exopolysaccharide synthesis family protein
MVTSATVGEGKTSLSCQLALSLARAKQRTLLIDCDMRRPAVHRVFDLPLSPGLGEVLCRENELRDALLPTPLEELWILPAGQPTGPPSQALAGDAFPTLLNGLRDQFDFIIVDSCPVLPVSDTLLVGQHVDGVIFTLLRDVSCLPQVYAGYQRLASLGIRVLGIVVNGVGGGSYGSAYTEYQYVSACGK